MPENGDRPPLTALDRTVDRKKWWETHDKETYECPDCGRTNDHPEFRQWEVHHINGEPGNVVALCQKCHNVRHGAERKSISVEWWKDEFLSVGNEE